MLNTTPAPGFGVQSMSSFYTIIYAGINPVAGDKLAVGLFMRGAQKPRFAWSKNRADVVKDLMGRDAHKLLVYNLKALQRQCDTEGQLTTGLFTELPAAEFSGQLLQEPYFEYLTKYSRNLLTFGLVTALELEANDERFRSLFHLLVDDQQETAQAAPVPDIEDVRQLLRQRTEKYVTWEVVVDQALVPGLLMPSVEIGFYGRNSHDVIGEVVDFERPEYHIEKQLYELNDVARALDEKQRLGKAFVVGDEPDKKARPKQHATWVVFRANKQFTVVPSGESAQVDEHMEKEGVKPVVFAV